MFQIKLPFRYDVTQNLLEFVKIRFFLLSSLYTRNVLAIIDLLFKFGQSTETEKAHLTSLHLQRIKYFIEIWHLSFFQSSEYYL